MILFTIKNALLNLVRYKKRYITAGILMAVVMTVFIASAFYYSVSSTEYRQNMDVYLPWHELRFRDELQYRGWRGYNDTNVNSLEAEQNFNYDGSMDKYDYDLHVARGWFDRFADMTSVSEYALGYAEAAYSDVYFRYSDAVERRGLTVYGGSADSLMTHDNDFITARSSSVLREMHFVEGREAESGKNECAVYETFAEENALSLGDTLTLYGEDGEILTALTVCGIIRCEQNEYGNYSTADVMLRGYTVGSMPYRRPLGSFGYTLFTDFATAYYLYGDETAPDFAQRHCFNKYVPLYKLTDRNMSAQFIREAEKMLADAPENDIAAGEAIDASVFGFTQLVSAAEQLNSPFLFDMEDSGVIMRTVGLLDLAIISVVLYLSLRRRSRETGILSALGIRRSVILLGWGCELLFFILAVNIAGTLLCKCANMAFIASGMKLFRVSRSFAPTPTQTGITALLGFALLTVTTAASAIYLRVRSPSALIGRK